MHRQASVSAQGRTARQTRAPLREDHRSAGLGDAVAEGALRPELGDGQVQALRRSVGARLRLFRSAGGLSLRALAKKCNLTSGFLSQIENGHVMPSIATLVRLCDALDVEIGEIFAAVMPRGRVVARDERAAYVWPDCGIRDEILSVDATKRLEVLHSYIEPGGSTGPPFAHGSDVEVAFVLKGRIVVEVGDERYVLHVGDALTFPGSLSHAIHNPGKVRAEVVWALTPATF